MVEPLRVWTTLGKTIALILGETLLSARSSRRMNLLANQVIWAIGLLCVGTVCCGGSVGTPPTEILSTALTFPCSFPEMDVSGNDAVIFPLRSVCGNDSSLSLAGCRVQALFNDPIVWRNDLSRNCVRQSGWIG
jgi:hypothetical protein